MNNGLVANGSGSFTKQKGGPQNRNKNKGKTSHRSDGLSSNGKFGGPTKNYQPKRSSEVMKDDQE